MTQAPDTTEAIETQAASETAPEIAGIAAGGRAAAPPPSPENAAA